MEESPSTKIPTPPSSRPTSLRRPRTRHVTRILSQTANRDPHPILYHDASIYRKADENQPDQNESEKNLLKYKILPAIGSSSDLRDEITMNAKNNNKQSEKPKQKKSRNGNKTYPREGNDGKSLEDVLSDQDIQIEDASTISKDISTKTLSASSADGFKLLEIAIRLPDGTRLENCFYDYCKFSDLLQFLMKSCISDEVIPRNYEFVTSEVPQQVFSDFSVTLSEAKIKTRTLLYLRELNPD